MEKHRNKVKHLRFPASGDPRNFEDSPDPAAVQPEEMFEGMEVASFY